MVGPHGFTTPETELNLTVGRGYRFSMKPPDGDLFHLSGEFAEINPGDPPHHLRLGANLTDDRETVVTLGATP
ncbi:MAG: hypothetical protein WKF73_07290 [Nocardioidaceae bacterium]